MSRWRWVAVACLIPALDQFTKWVASQRLLPGETVPLWGSVLSLRLVHNKGIAFGLLSSLVAPLTILAAITILYFTRRVGRELGFGGAGGIAIGLVLGGAIGNLIDRVRMGYVTDFIDVWRWPTFNGADIAIVCGCAVLAVLYMRQGSGGAQ